MCEFLLIVAVCIAMWFYFGALGAYDDIIQNQIHICHSRGTKLPLPLSIIAWIRQHA